MAKLRLIPPQQSNWTLVCPPELRLDQSNTSQTSQRILKAAHVVDVRTLSKHQKTAPHLRIAGYRSRFKSWWDLSSKKKLLLILHTDKLEACNPGIKDYATMPSRNLIWRGLVTNRSLTALYRMLFKIALSSAFLNSSRYSS